MKLVKEYKTQSGDIKISDEDFYDFYALYDKYPDYSPLIDKTCFINESATGYFSNLRGVYGNITRVVIVNSQIAALEFKATGNVWGRPGFGIEPDPLYTKGTLYVVPIQFTYIENMMQILQDLYVYSWNTIRLKSVLNTWMQPRDYMLPNPLS